MIKTRWATWGARLQQLLLVALMIAMVFDPSTGVLGLDTYRALLWSFGGVALIVAATTRFSALRATYRPREVFAYAITFAVLIPLFAAAVYLLRHGTGAHIRNVFGRTYTEFFVLMVGVALGVGGAWFFRLASWSLTALAGLVWILYGIGIAGDRRPLSVYLRDHGLATYSTSHFGPLFPHIHYFTNPLLVLAGAYWLARAVRRTRLWSVELIPFGLVVTAMMMSGTRSNVVLAGFLLLGLAWRISRRFAVTCVAIALIAGAIYVGMHGIYALLGQGAANSDAVRRGLLPAYGHGYADTSRLLFGDGLGSCMYSADRPSCWLVTEFTPLDLLRIFGVLGAGLYAVLLTLPLMRIRTTHPALWWAWLLYLMYALTSPSLFSPVGAIMIAMAALATCERATVAHRVASPTP